MGRNPVSMNSFRRLRLTRVLVCLSGLLAAGSILLAQQTTPPPANTPAAPAIQAPQFETPTAAQPAATQKLAPDVIEAIDFRGSRRVPQDTLRALIFSRKGDVYNEETLHRDFMALWNTNRFDDITLETEKGDEGGIIIRWVLTEKRMVRNIT